MKYIKWDYHLKSENIIVRADMRNTILNLFKLIQNNFKKSLHCLLNNEIFKANIVPLISGIILLRIVPSRFIGLVKQSHPCLLWPMLYNIFGTIYATMERKQP